MNDTMASDVPTRAPLELPRRLAIQLLHQAQTADAAGCASWVLARGEPGLIVRCDVADPVGDRAGQLTQATQSGWQAWALFRYRGERHTVPSVAEFAAAAPLVELLLTASLATKGVLQLRAWKLEHGTVHEAELRIRD